MLHYLQRTVKVVLPRFLKLHLLTMASWLTPYSDQDDTKAIDCTNEPRGLKMADIGPNTNGHAGGLGGEPHRSKPRSFSHERLLARALRGGWRIPVEARDDIVGVLLTVAKDPDATRRERVGACRALIAAGKADLDATRTVVLTKRLGKGDDTRERAAEVGRTLREFLDETRRLAAIEEAKAELEAERAQLHDDPFIDGMYQP